MGKILNGNTSFPKIPKPEPIFPGGMNSTTCTKALFGEVHMEALSRVIEEKARPLAVEGLTGSSQGYFLARFWSTFRSPLLVLSPDTQHAENLIGDLRYFLKHFRLKVNPRIFPGWELLPYEPLSPLSEISGERVDLLYKVAAGHCPIVVMTVETAMQKVLPRSVLEQMTYSFKTGDTADRELLEICLLDNGYERTGLVEARNQYSIRGDILDVFLPSHKYPVRLEFFDDEIESIRHFDVTSQISIEVIDQIDILPVNEICLNSSRLEKGLKTIRQVGEERGTAENKLSALLEKIECLKNFAGIEWMAPYFSEGLSTVFDYLQKNTVVVVQEPEILHEKGEAFAGLIEEEYDRSRHGEEVVPTPESLYLDWPGLQESLRRYSGLTMGALKLAEQENDSALQFSVKSLPPLYNHFDGFAASATAWKKDNLPVTVVAPTKGHVSRINELLLEKELPVAVEVGLINQGFVWPEPGTVFVAEHEIFGRSHKHRTRRRSRSARFNRGFQDLNKGDLLVHVEYGIGKYNKTRELQTGVGGGEFLEILFADDQKLYIPMDGLAAVQKFVGSGDSHPPLSKLGGVTWKRQKKKIQESIRKMAKELVRVYAERQLSQSHVYHSDPVLMQEFSDSFEYVETEDQLKAIEEVLEDLEMEKPMDRLICGDVGYGKTEVAMRAAFKVVLDKKQVAVLAPTTILSQQHLNTFRERFRSWPITVEMVSRFRTAAEQKETIRKVKEGKVDIVIGTHRLLSKDVTFANLGLVVIDEEQRFGVKHKEQLKKLRASVDIMTLTATPIPRTLHFSLMGVRDLSVIETPPSDRLAVKTYIRKFETRVIRDAILRELDRNGQVFFVHNQIQGIHTIAKLIQEAVPQARIGIAHGQLQEQMLERTMKQFLDGELDILLSTSIIESGLDIPNANTIIINRADRFGLAQLYQLRGRVGRYKHQAYAYFLIPGEMTISTDARKRLSAIEEMSELGAGFQLATRDLEIRGTGNMLGKSQSGHIATIGFDLYCQMMEETVRELKGEKVESKIDTELDLQIRGYIPKEYIPELNQRLEFYRRLQLIIHSESLEEIRKEMKDRCGALPEPTEKLFVLIELKLLCQELRISRIRLNKNEVAIQIEKDTPVEPGQLAEILGTRLKMAGEFQLILKINTAGWRENAQQVMECLKSMQSATGVS